MLDVVLENYHFLLNFIKGKNAEIAVRDLEFSRKRIARDVIKTVKSAVSNAENNNQFDIDNLIIKEAYVGKSIVMKKDSDLEPKVEQVQLRNLTVE